MLIFLLIISLLIMIVLPKGTVPLGNCSLVLQFILLSIPLPTSLSHEFQRDDLGIQYSCLLVVFVNYSTYHNSSISFSSFFPKGRGSFGEVQIWVVLFIVYLRLALSLRTTPKGRVPVLEFKSPLC